MLDLVFFKSTKRDERQESVDLLLLEKFFKSQTVACAPETVLMSLEVLGVYA